MRAKVIAGAAVTCFLNSRPYGRVKSFQFSSATAEKPQYALDSSDPYEISPTTTRVVGRLTLYRTVGDAGAEGAGMAVRYEDIPLQKYFRIVLIERGSNTAIFEANYCTVISQNWTIPERGIVTGTIEFTALQWNNELRPVSA